MAPSEDVETTTQVQVVPVDPHDDEAFAAWFAVSEAAEHLRRRGVAAEAGDREKCHEPRGIRCPCPDHPDIVHQCTAAVQDSRTLCIERESLRNVT